MLAIVNCVWLTLCFFGVRSENDYLEAQMSVPELIKYKGYPAEIHHVTTEDGYILGLHRIPFGIKGDSGIKRPVVLLSPGIACSSAVFVVLGPKKSLSYYLADRGFDVWILNHRGGFYSSNHTTLNVDTEEEAYFDYSWHEMGINDLPASIDYILGITENEKLFHVGFSQGTTTFYMMMSQRPQYNNKIFAHISLAPVVYLRNAISPLVEVLAENEEALRNLAYNLGSYQMNPWTNPLYKIMRELCPLNFVNRDICVQVLSSILGYQPGEFDKSKTRVIYGHFPDTVSVKQVLHYVQLKRYPKHRFCQFNYGITENLLRYSSASPPEYQLNNTKVPVYLFYGENDWFTNWMDVHKLFKNVGSKIKYLLYVEDYNHVNFIFGKNAHKVIYKPVAKILRKLADLKKSGDLL